MPIPLQVMAAGPVSWMAPSTGPTSGLTGDLGTLINRSRAALRNDPWASAGITKLVANIVGTGIKPKSDAADDQFRKELQQLFLDWTDESDADGMLDFMVSSHWLPEPCWKRVSVLFACAHEDQKMV